MPPDALALRTFLTRAARRLAWLSVAEGAAVGLALAAVAAIVGWPQVNAIVLGVGLAVVGGAAAVLLARARRTNVAALVERRAPECRNLVVTADELPTQRVTDRVATLVYAQAARLIQRLDLAALFPARNRVAALGIAATLWALAIARTATAPPAAARNVRGSSTPSVGGIDIIVVPPKYTGRPSQTLHDPARVEALVGSELRITVKADAVRLAVFTLQSGDTLSATTGSFTTTISADADGYVAVEPLAADGHAGVRRLVGLSVIADDAPRVRITAPGRDTYHPNGRVSLDVAVESSDDIGLAGLRLRYTKVAGSGERFTFTEGEVPLAVTRRSDRAWTARVQWRLDSLALGPGDMVVYRAVATDHRPGAPPSESDSYIAEVTAPGGNAAAGFALDPEQERYAVSQQMVILKSERLSARKTSMSADDYGNASQEIAAEQRKVRAEFVFMMGGELADAPDPDEDPNVLNEEAEAEGEADLAAGRNLNQGRAALIRAIRSMSRAAQSLNVSDLTTALTHERAALVQLERAFSRTRIILRALTQRERLDLSRRLTGVLTDAARDTRPRIEPELNPRTIALRRTLAGIATLAGSATFAPNDAARASELAESVLRIDASAKPIQDAASLLTSAAAAIGRNRRDEARNLLDRAATSIAAAVRTELLAAPRVADTGLDQLSGALGDALRSRGRP